jgi:death-on-curing protein
VDFIDVEHALEIHANQILLYGGEAGVRDMGLLDSALAQPRAGFGGQMLHADIYEMAAAYLFHIVKNHPFIDGNKRAGLATALTFLQLHNLEVIDPETKLYDITIAVAESRIGKPEVAAFFRANARADSV